MRKSIETRLHQADKVAASAYSLFDRAAEDLELAAQMQRQIYDDIQERIDVLQVQQASAQAHGMRAADSAKRLRKLFL